MIYVRRVATRAGQANSLGTLSGSRVALRDFCPESICVLCYAPNVGLSLFGLPLWRSRLLYFSTHLPFVPDCRDLDSW